MSMFATSEKYKTPTIFISYTWDDEGHKKWVLELANRLSQSGVHVFLDRYDLLPGTSMTAFMERAVRESDKVILILTPQFKQRADNRVGGAGFEYAMISQQIYQEQGSQKFIPVIRKGDSKESAPTFVSTLIYIDMRDDGKMEESFESLLRQIYEEPLITRPPLGKKPDFTSGTTAAKPAIELPTGLIDLKKDMAESETTAYAKWRMMIEFPPLHHLEARRIGNLMESFRPIAIYRNVRTPTILHERFQEGYDPNSKHEIPLQKIGEEESFCHGKLDVKKGNLIYEYAEFTREDIISLHIEQPFVELLYILVTLGIIHRRLKSTITLKVTIDFRSNLKAVLIRDTPTFEFKPIYNRQPRSIPGNKATFSYRLTTLDKRSLFTFFGDLFHLFIEENPQSNLLVPELDKNAFKKMMNERFDESTLPG